MIAVERRRLRARVELRDIENKPACTSHGDIFGIFMLFLL